MLFKLKWFTRNCTHFLKIGFLIAGGGFYSYCIQQGNKLDKEIKIERKMLSFMHTKRLNTLSKMGAIPCLCNSTSTLTALYSM